MAEAKLVSGRLRLDVSFIDRKNEYKVKMCPVVSGEKCETQYVGAISSGPRSVHGKRLGVDDPRALISAAKAAISFASRDIQDYADYNRRGTGYVVRPARRRSRR